MAGAYKRQVLLGSIRMARFGQGAPPRKAVLRPVTASHESQGALHGPTMLCWQLKKRSQVCCVIATAVRRFTLGVKASREGAQIAVTHTKSDDFWANKFGRLHSARLAKVRTLSRRAIFCLWIDSTDTTTSSRITFDPSLSTKCRFCYWMTPGRAS